MPDEINYKLLMDAELKSRIDAVFGEHGMKINIATQRILAHFVEMPKDLRAMMLNQVTSEGSKALCKMLLRHFAADVAPNFESIVAIEDDEPVSRMTMGGMSMKQSKMTRRGKEK